MFLKIICAIVLMVLIIWFALQAIKTAICLWVLKFDAKDRWVSGSCMVFNKETGKLEPSSGRIRLPFE